MSDYVVYLDAPASEVEWEELLVRYELGPRALRVALDDLGDDEGTAERVGELLRGLVLHELRAADLFAAMRERRPASTERGMEIRASTPRAAYERYAELRGRNFAAMQRRGIDVWGWRTEAPGRGTVTAHQLILSSTALDGETLAGIRMALRGARAC